MIAHVCVTGGDIFGRLEAGGKLPEAAARQAFSQLLDGTLACVRCCVQTGCVRSSFSLVIRYSDICIFVSPVSPFAGADYIHTAGLAHLDLSLENVMLKEDTGKIIDFGTAKSVPDLTGGPLGPGFVGKRQYAAPEVCV